MTSKEIKIAYQEYDSIEQLSSMDRELAEAAIQATEGSYAPYSKFNVGAAVRLDSGLIVKGANQENAAYPSGLCAERTALFYASAARPDKVMTAIAIAASQNGVLCDSPATPCGACRQVLSEGVWNDVAGMKVRYFIVPHDATQTVGYAIEVEGHKFVIMTDIGRMTDEAVEFARQADTVVVESNYDMDMLMSGPYTYELKMRIVQGCGHLSNDECASAIRRFWHPGLRNIFLCHLSENNNTHDLAYRCSLAALESMGVTKGSLSLRCLPRQYPSQLFTL